MRGSQSPSGPAALLSIGSPRFLERDLAEIAARDGAAAAWIAAFDRHDKLAPMHVHGDFAIAVRDGNGRVFLAVDRFSIQTLCYRVGGDAIEVNTRADGVAGRGSERDPQAIFDYLYFHCIPAPRTIFKDVRRLPAGHCGKFENGRLVVERWWNPVFVEDRAVPFEDLRDEFRKLLRECVARQIDGDTTACFLSGGTDSSTVAGITAELTGRPPQTFSIGFHAEGYDEMRYARIAARHFKTDHHEYYVTPDDLVASIPLVAASCDQPFGNSSVVPAYYCAKLARESGATKILGGDGGDELFGGNSRYAKQRVFGVYSYIPRILRKELIEPLALSRNPAMRWPGVKKAASYVEQARVPMPDRIQMYNLLIRLGVTEVLTADFLASIDADEPMRVQRSVYDATAAKSLINQMLAFDWRYTLADNDLPKVIGATALAGIPAGFPLLDDALTDFSLSLQSQLKLNGLRLRWFFKQALRGFLPDEILAKKKHGFGLPFGVWVNHHDGLRTLATDSVRELANRGIVRKEFVERLIREHLPAHPGYYGEMVWILMMLEQWIAG